MSSSAGDIPLLDYAQCMAEASPSAAQRLRQLETRFESAFDERPEFFVRVPGRVNLIGEHIDYSGYPVLPMAIEQNILLAVSSTDDDELLEVRNVDSVGYPQTFAAAINAIARIELPTSGKPAWYNYVLCGVLGMREHLRHVDGQRRRMRGMRVMCSGNVPAAAGLSSSSALVCAATLAVGRSNAMLGTTAGTDCAGLAQLAARAERHIGTEGGGMDQAIALLARAGHAMFIDWSPLRATRVPLPAGVVFVIGNSLAQANKADSASAFNRRVVECRLACAMLGRELRVAEWRQLRRFADLEQRLGVTRPEFGRLVEEGFGRKSDAFGREEICRALDITDEELRREFLTENTRDMQTFWLYRRALHVVHERDRVYAFRAAAEACDVRRMGELMRASHESLCSKYDCSHPCLDRMVEVGAGRGFASRLTGAGWGGCTVALCESGDRATEYMDVLRDHYYDPRAPPAEADDRQQAADDERMFATSPQGGAAIIVRDLQT